MTPIRARTPRPATAAPTPTVPSAPAPLSLVRVFSLGLPPGPVANVSQTVTGFLLLLLAAILFATFDAVQAIMADGVFVIPGIVINLVLLILTRVWMFLGVGAGIAVLPWVWPALYGP